MKNILIPQGLGGSSHQNVTVKLLCRSALTDALTEKLIDTANGKITVHKGEEGFENFT